MSPRPTYFSPDWGSASELCSASTGRLRAPPGAISYPLGEKAFSTLSATMAGQPLHEMGPAGARPAALGFALGLAASWAGRAGVLWAGEDEVFAEEGAPYPPGLAAFGLDPSRLIVIRAHKREEALWAAEQGLSAPGAVVLCTLGGRGKPLDLKATRRLLLFAERHQSRCLLVRPLAEASAAWTRWRVAPAPSQAEPGELGPPAYAIELVRSRGGASGARFSVQWNAQARSFEERRQEQSEPVFPVAARQA